MFDFSYSNILHSNLINFAIMLGLFMAVFAFLNVPKKLSDLVDEVKKNLEKSNSDKELSSKDLKTAEEKFKNSDTEAQDIISSANKISDDFMSKARQEADFLIEGIKEDYEKIYEREIQKIKKDVILNVSLKSLEKTEQKLKETFKNKELQENFINTSIEKLEGIDF